jgi:hypothetical protein
MMHAPPAWIQYPMHLKCILPGPPCISLYNKVQHAQQAQQAQQPDDDGTLHQTPREVPRNPSPHHCRSAPSREKSCSIRRPTTDSVGRGLAAGDCGVSARSQAPPMCCTQTAGSVEEVWGKSMRRFFHLPRNLCHSLLLGTFSHLAVFSFICSKTDKTHDVKLPTFIARQSTRLHYQGSFHHGQKSGNGT